MKQRFTDFLFKHVPADALSRSQILCVADHFEKFLDTPEFAKHMAARMSPLPDLGLGNTVNLRWRIIMSQLTQGMADAIAALQTRLGEGVSPEQMAAAAHAAIDPQLQALATQIGTIQTAEADDAAKLTDVTNAVQAFIDGMKSTAPTPAPAPDVAPSPAPDSPPDSAA